MAENQSQQIIVHSIRSNGVGVAGFVMAVISIFIGWIPFIGAIPLGLAILFSIIALFRSPRGLAIAGLIVSLIVSGITLLIYQGIWLSLAIEFGENIGENI